MKASSASKGYAQATSYDHSIAFLRKRYGKAQFDATLAALAQLSQSDRDMTPAPVDDLVDSYLDGFGAKTFEERRRLADALFVAAPSRRTDQADLPAHLKRIIP